PAAVDPAVHRDGLAGAGGDQAAAGRARWLDTRLAAGRWRLLHAGNILLPPAFAALFARGVAPVRGGRQRLPLHLGDGTGGLTTTQQKARVAAGFPVHRNVARIRRRRRAPGSTRLPTL